MIRKEPFYIEKVARALQEILIWAQWEFQEVAYSQG